MKSGSLSCYNVFIWISSIVGFIVDTVALVALISEARVADVSVPQLPRIPKLELGILALKWEDITLMLLIYVGLAFAAISVSRWLSATDFGTAFIPHSLLVHLFAALLILWLIVFVPFGDPALCFHIAEAWLLGFISLLLISRYRKDPLDNEWWKTIALHLSSLLIVLPGWALLEKALYGLPWGMAFSSAIAWGLVGVVGSPVLWISPLAVPLFGFVIVFIIRLLIERREPPEQTTQRRPPRGPQGPGSHL
jgi:hypothetical protein